MKDLLDFTAHAVAQEYDTKIFPPEYKANMVIIKAAFDNEIRKITVESDISYSDLVQKLVRVFPSLGEQNADDVRLYYRDADGDNISFCTDEELRTALEHAGTDNTIRVLIAIKVKESTPSHGLMDADFFSDSWSDPFFHHGLSLSSLFGTLGHHLHHHPFGAFFQRTTARPSRERRTATPAAIVRREGAEG